MRPGKSGALRSRCACQRPGGANAGKENKETQYVIVTKDDEARYMI